MQSKLHLPHVCCNGSDLSRIRLVYEVVRRVQVDVVEHVIVFPAELDCLAFGDGEDLTEGKIHEEGSRTDERIASSITVSIEALGCRESSWTKPFCTVGVCDVGIANLVRSHVVEVCVQQWRVADIWRKWHAAGGRGDAAGLPTTGDEVSETIDIRTEALTMPKGQYPNVGYGELVPSIETGRSVVRLVVEVVIRDASQFGIVERFRVRVGHDEVESTRLMFYPLHLERMVVGVVTVADAVDTLG